VQRSEGGDLSGKRFRWLSFRVNIFLCRKAFFKSSAAERRQKSKPRYILGDAIVDSTRTPGTSHHNIIITVLYYSNSSKSMSEQEYERISGEAVEAFQQGQHRLSATKYMESFQATPTVWSRGRYHIFHGYCSILLEKYFAPSPQDLEFLQHVFNDKAEPKLHRCQAVFHIKVPTRAATR